MEEMSKENDGKKRVRDDSDLDSPEEKRVESGETESTLPKAKRARKDSDLYSSEFNRVESDESVLNSPEANRIPDDILDILDEPDAVTESDSAIQDLDSVIKSFEEEISHPSPAAEFPAIPSEHGESQIDLGYLLEASDDELGLPPTVSPADEKPETKAESYDLAIPSEVLGFEGELWSYDSFEFGTGGETQLDGDDFVAVGGLFDYDSADFLEFLSRPGSFHV